MKFRRIEKEFMMRINSLKVSMPKVSVMMVNIKELES